MKKIAVLQIAYGNSEFGQGHVFDMRTFENQISTSCDVGIFYVLTLRSAGNEG
jgi:hypothetical protein